jgi:hypothetical protein
MKATQAPHDLGQSIWLDNITRDRLDSGALPCCSHASGRRVRRIARPSRHLPAPRRALPSQAFPYCQPPPRAL